MKRFCIVLSLLFVMTYGLDAQTMTNKERRYMNSRVLNIVEEYERWMSVESDRAEYNLRKIFHDNGTPVYCDIIGLPLYRKIVPLDKYISDIRNNVDISAFVISDVRKGEYVWENGIWRIPVTFRKSIFYFDGKGYVFSTDLYYGKDFDIVMNVVYDPSSDRCFIDSIEGEISSEKSFPEGRFLIVEKNRETTVPEKQRKYFSELTLGGQAISYNQYGQAILPSAEPCVRDIDVTPLVDTVSTGPNYDVVCFSFEKRNSRLKPRFAYAPFGAYDVTTSDGISHSSSAFEVGLDYGVTWMAGKSSKMGFFTGIGLSSSRLNLSAAPGQYDYITSRYDTSTGLYKMMTVRYDLDFVSEAMSLTDLYLPLYFEFEHKAGNHLLVSWSVGAKLYANLRTTYDMYSVSGRYGIKDQLGNDTGQIEWAHSFDSFLNPVSYARSPYDASVFGRLGLDVNLYRKRIYFSLGASFEYGLTDSYKAMSLNPYYEKNSLYPVIYNPYDEQHIAVHSLVSSTSYRRQALWLEAGIKIKL